MTQAQQHPATNYFGNTLYVAIEGSPEHSVYYYPDNTFEIHFPDSEYRGTYAVDGDRICLTAIRPGDTMQTTSAIGSTAHDKRARAGRKLRRAA